MRSSLRAPPPLGAGSSAAFCWSAADTLAAAVPAGEERAAAAISTGQACSACSCRASQKEVQRRLPCRQVGVQQVLAPLTRLHHWLGSGGRALKALQVCAVQCIYDRLPVPAQAQQAARQPRRVGGRSAGRAGPDPLPPVQRDSPAAHGEPASQRSGAAPAPHLAQGGKHAGRRGPRAAHLEGCAPDAGD